jgi:hypothetical protein
MEAKMNNVVQVHAFVFFFFTDRTFPLYSSLRYKDKKYDYSLYTVFTKHVQTTTCFGYT